MSLVNRLPYPTVAEHPIEFQILILEIVPPFLRVLRSAFAPDTPVLWRKRHKRSNASANILRFPQERFVKSAFHVSYSHCG